jgi:hypothetical protein
MSVTVEDVKQMSAFEITFYYYRFTEDYLKAEGWTRGAIRKLYVKMDELDEQRIRERKGGKDGR